MSDQTSYITKDGLGRLKEELHHLKSVKRKEVAWRIQQAKELGDLSENAEYTEAKNEQAFLEGRILELENVIKNAIVIEQSSGGAGGVHIVVGSMVTVVTDDGHPLSLSIVGSQEADPKQGRISNESPLGSALLGHAVGDKIEFQAPKGMVVYTIKEIH